MFSPLGGWGCSWFYYVALEGWCLHLHSLPQTPQVPTVVSHHLWSSGNRPGPVPRCCPHCQSSWNSWYCNPCALPGRSRQELVLDFVRILGLEWGEVLSLLSLLSSLSGTVPSAPTDAPHRHSVLCVTSCTGTPWPKIVHQFFLRAKQEL